MPESPLELHHSVEPQPRFLPLPKRCKSLTEIEARIRHPRKREAANEQLGPVNWFKILDGFVIVILLALFFYFFNSSTNGDFARVLVGLFPREFEALGLKEYFERLSSDDPRITKQDLT